LAVTGNSFRRWKPLVAGLLGLFSVALVILPLSALFADAFPLAAMHDAMQRAGAMFLEV